MGASAPDIITYIGVPLAVLGVTPIFWLAYRAIVKKLKVSRDIEKNNLIDTSTQAELLSGIVEVTLYQYQLEILDRTEDGYWTHNPGRQPPEGGSWAIFQWREPYQKIRKVTRRLQYSDQLRLPRAKVDFESLVIFLLDRGTSFRPRRSNGQRGLGFRSLLNNGIRTPVGTTLLFGKDDEPLLVVAAPFDDELEGLPTLMINRKGIQVDQENQKLLPPGWLLLRSFSVIAKESIEKEKAEKSKPISTEINKEEEPIAASMQMPERRIVPSQSISSTTEENKSRHAQHASTIDDQYRDAGIKSSIGAQKDVTAPESSSHVDKVDIVYVSEDSSINNASQAVRSNDAVTSHELGFSYQIFLSATALNVIRTQAALKESVPMQTPDHLGTWFYAAAKAHAIEIRSVSRYTVPEQILNFIASRELLTNYGPLEILLSGKPMLSQGETVQQLDCLLACISEDWITIGPEIRKISESILKIYKRPAFGFLKSTIGSELKGLGSSPPGVSLVCAAALAWHWLISTNVVGSQLTSAEVTEGLLYGMIGDKEESEYFAHYMNSLVYGSDLASDLSEHKIRRGKKAEYRKRLTRFAKATWLSCSMAKHLPRDDNFRDAEACFIAYPTVLLG